MTVKLSNRRPKKRVWKELCYAMEAAGLDDDALAELMCVRPKTVQYWRLGRRVPADDGIELLTRHLPSTSVEKLKKDAPPRPSRNRYTPKIVMLSIE